MNRRVDASPVYPGVSEPVLFFGLPGRTTWTLLVVYSQLANLGFSMNYFLGLGVIVATMVVIHPSVLVLGRRNPYIYEEAVRYFSRYSDHYDAWTPFDGRVRRFAPARLR